MNGELESGADGSYLEKRLAALEALYRRYGRDGLKDQPIADVALLLSSKELRFRDAPKHSLSAEQQAANRQLELEIGDIRSYVKSQVARLSLADLRSFRQADRPQQHEQQRQFRPRDRGMER